MVAIADSVTNQWMALEVSSDLTSWTDLAQLFTAKHSYVYIDDDNPPEIPRRFYRVRVPGVSVAQARARWESQRIENYRFQIYSWDGPVVYEAQVTIMNGKKEISDVKIYQGLPVDFSPDIVPTIDDIFDWLEMASHENPVMLRAQYDPQLGFPYRCIILSRSFPPLDMLIFDFAPLPSGAGEEATAQAGPETQAESPGDKAGFGRVHIEGFSTPNPKGSKSGDKLDRAKLHMKKKSPDLRSRDRKTENNAGEAGPSVGMVSTEEKRSQAIRSR